MEQKSRDNTPPDPSLAGKGKTESGDSLDAAPPGSSIINSTRSGQAQSDNPVRRTDHDVADVPAPNTRRNPPADVGRE